MESKQHPAKFAKGRAKLDGVLVAEVTRLYGEVMQLVCHCHALAETRNADWLTLGQQSLRLIIQKTQPRK